MTRTAEVTHRLVATETITHQPQPQDQHPTPAPGSEGATTAAGERYRTGRQRRTRPVWLVIAYWLWLLAGPVFAATAAIGLIHPTMAPIVVVAAITIGPAASFVSLVLLGDVLQAVNQ
ncbi:MAG: hypothetical protein AAFN30_20985 [Actinomycetota bacterium]